MMTPTAMGRTIMKSAGMMVATVVKHISIGVLDALMLTAFVMKLEKDTASGSLVQLFIYCLHHNPIAL